MVKKYKTCKQSKIFPNYIEVHKWSQLNIRLKSAAQKSGTSYTVSGFSFLRLNPHFWALAKSKPVPALLHVSNLTFWQPYSFYSDTQAENFVLYSLIMAIANLILFCLYPYSLPSKPPSPDDLVSTASFVWPSLSLLLSQSVLHISQNSCLGLLPSSAHAIPLLTEHSPSATHNLLALTWKVPDKWTLCCLLYENLFVHF